MSLFRHSSVTFWDKILTRQIHLSGIRKLVRRVCYSFMAFILLIGSCVENDNLRSEYVSLYEDVEPDIRFASIALQREPDAINLWIGNDQSTTALHRDNYENIYCQILGSKEFVLLPPVETACVNEQFLPGATYNACMEIIPDDPPLPIPSAIWDPDRPKENPTRFSHLSRLMRVTLHSGDMLYLPACW